MSICIFFIIIPQRLIQRLTLSTRIRHIILNLTEKKTGKTGLLSLSHIYFSITAMSRTERIYSLDNSTDIS